MAAAALGDAERAWELFSLINPISHGAAPADISTYRVEPYVVAADVYGVAPHAGRGGWTWYTGSAGWMYRLIIESLLGLRLQVDKLRFTPCLPPDAGWRGAVVRLRDARRRSPRPPARGRIALPRERTAATCAARRIKEPGQEAVSPASRFPYSQQTRMARSAQFRGTRWIAEAPGLVPAPGGNQISNSARAK